MALTDSGYNIPSLREIIESLEAQARLEYGPTIDTTPDSALGHFIATVSIEISALYEDLKALYDSLDGNSATGKILDKICFLSHLIRKPATYSTATVTFTGTAGALVPQATIVSIGDSTVGRFITDNNITLGASGTADVTVTCLTEGPIPVRINSIDTVRDTVPLVTAVNNFTAGNLGTEVETDAELLARRLASSSITGDATLGSVEAKLMSLAGVTEVKVFENDTFTPLDRGDGTLRPAKSVECIVEGGSDSLIASTIQELKPAGIQYYGLNTVDVLTGSPRLIQFTRPVVKTLRVTVDPSIYDEEVLPPDYQDRIKDGIIAFTDTEYVLGKDVLPQRLLVGLLGITGIAGATIQVAVDNDPLTSNAISIADFEHVSLSRENITIV